MRYALRVCIAKLELFKFNKDSFENLNITQHI